LDEQGSRPRFEGFCVLGGLAGEHFLKEFMHHQATFAAAADHG
jgi:hypothetical protein